MERIYALVDCDSFFVSCEQAVNPELKNKPVAVTGGEYGCVVSRSKEAKQYGLPMGYPVFMAKKEYKNVIYIKGNHELYKDFSNKVINILKNFSPNVEVCSIDEAYVDFTGLCKLYKKNYYDLAVYLREKILNEIDIPVSIGVSTTKTLAKFASDYAKHVAGVYLIGKSKLKKILPNTKIDSICGIGRRMKVALNKEGILTCGEFVQKSDEWLKSKYSITYVELKHEILGESIYNIFSGYKAPKSIQETSTFNPATNDISFLKNELNKHIKDACRKLRKHELKTSVIGVMLKTKDFVVYYDKLNLEKPMDSELEISKNVFKLFEKIYNQNLLYRSSGVVLERLSEKSIHQTTLFSEQTNEKTEHLSKTIDKIEQKFGKGSIKTGFL
ncbi:hypothetical protein IJG72_08770 [bacterium]|nr:hypothetical protein [bacterium]